MSKHDLGGDINDSDKVPKKLSGLMFVRQQQNFPRGHAIISEKILIPEGKYPNGTYHYADFADYPGRNIYVSPHGNDTVYYNYPDSYIEVGNIGFLMPIGDTKNQNLAKAKFLLLTRRSLPYDNSSRDAWKRARMEK